jgi:hypothetical protein
MALTTKPRVQGAAETGCAAVTAITAVQSIRCFLRTKLPPLLCQEVFVKAGLFAPFTPKDPSLPSATACAYARPHGPRKTPRGLRLSLSALAQRHPLRRPPAGMQPEDRAQAYGVQADIEEYSARRPVGWKIAATSKAGQAHIGVTGRWRGGCWPSARLKTAPILPWAIT